MRRVRVNASRCKVCWHREPDFQCIVPHEVLYELFRCRQKIVTGPARKMPIAPCTATCPANICVQGYVGLIAAGLYEQAYRLIRSRVPFVHTLSLICPHPCEEQCIRADYDQPIAVNALKRFVAEWVPSEVRRRFLSELKAGIRENGKRVAVIGAGPAGLTAAHDLRLRGYAVTVFEAYEKPGGMLRVGIPEFRLPRTVLDGEIEEILQLGMELKTGVRIGQEIALEELLDEYAAVFLAAGAHLGETLQLPGAGAQGVLDALQFLREVNLDHKPRVGKYVAVIGGGDSAVDAARVARRLGAQEVVIYYRRSQSEMPAHTEQIEQAQAEGIKIIERVAPVRFLTERGKLNGVELVQMKPGAPDESGRRRPIPMPGSNFTVDADTVLTAIGQRPAMQFWQNLRVELDPHGWVRTDINGMTSVAGLFAGGDTVSGPATVIGAIAAGKRAAYGIDRYVRGEDAPPITFRTPSELKDMERYHPMHVPLQGRHEMAQALPAKRVRDFRLVEMGLTEAQARAEANRCLTCGLCANCNACLNTFACPAIYVAELRKIGIDEVLCTGCEICVQLCPNDALELEEVEVKREEAVGA